MKKRKHPVLFLFVLLCVLFSCTLDQQPTADNNDTTNNNPTNSSVARVTGVIKDSNGTPMLGVVIVATDATTGRTYSADTGTTGTFTLHVPKGNPMIYAIIDEEGKACGVLCGTLPSGTSSRDVSNPVVSTGIKVNADVALGDIEIPNTPGMIDMTNKAELDAEIVAKIDATTSELIGFTGGAEHGKGDTLQVDGGLFT
ncbi:MAG: carboxypeptidase-like regulatory domain-containing protein, partial [Sphaerochaetaceae bacterium]|nr:carboxypeptidase-like regulatory domain-containing protein [Sphaerochaetaceae bacterium]